jgi:hypothetical protein
MLKKLMKLKRKMNQIEVCELINLRSHLDTILNSKKRQISFLIIHSREANISTGKYAGK